MPAASGVDVGHLETDRPESKLGLAAFCLCSFHFSLLTSLCLHFPCRKEVIKTFIFTGTGPKVVRMRMRMITGGEHFAQFWLVGLPVPPS